MAGPVANIVGVSFVDIATTRMHNLQVTLDAVIAAETGVLNPILRALMIIYIGRQFFLWMSGDMVMRRFLDSIIRAGVIVLLVTHNGAFVQWVETPVFERIPTAMANLVTGNFAALPTGAPMAERFDAIAAKGDAIMTEIDSVSTHVFSITDWINSITGRTANELFQLVLAIIVGIWLLGQTLLAIVLAFTLPVLLLELFDRTRGFVDQTVAKFVGMTAFGFASSFVLALMLNGMETMFDRIHGQAANNAAAAAGLFFHVLGDGVLDLLTIAALPMAVGYGSGVVAGLAAPSAILTIRSLSIAGSGAAAAALGAGKGALYAARSAVGGIRKP